MNEKPNLSAGKNVKGIHPTVEERIVKAHLEDGLTPPLLAERFSVTQCAVIKVLKKYGSYNSTRRNRNASRT